MVPAIAGAGGRGTSGFTGFFEVYVMFQKPRVVLWRRISTITPTFRVADPPGFVSHFCVQSLEKARLRMTQFTIQEEALGTEPFRWDVLAGLLQSPKVLPCKYFYDEAGSQLFDQICELDEYYLTRTELQIMEDHAGEMAGAFGPACVLVEYGSGSSWKSRLLLDRLDGGSVYVPVDIAREHLRQTAARLADQYPDLRIRPVCADFTMPFVLPKLRPNAGRTIVYFPGSTIGNFPPARAVDLLKQMRRLAGTTGGILIGVDLPKSRDILEAAYDDEQGVTARFNLNLLHRINRELDADIPVDRFEHQAIFNERESRVEMHLVSAEEQTLTIAGAEFDFAEGETIHTENSYKYGLEYFADLAAQAGLSVRRVWCDAEKLFSVQFLVPSEN